jgi:hypothetical protein
MANIAKHYSKKEWECNSCKYRWVDFLIGGHAVRVDDILKGFCELVSFKVSWWVEFRVFHFFNLQSKLPRRLILIVESFG